MGFNIAIRLVKIYKTNDFNRYPKNNVLSVFVGLYDSIMPNYKNSQAIYELILKGINYILQPGVEFLNELIFKSKFILDYVLDAVLGHPKISIRATAISIIAQLTSTKRKMITNELINKNRLLDIVLEASKYNSSNVNIYCDLCLIVSNSIFNSSEDLETVFYHPVFSEFILSQLHESTPIVNYL